MACRAIELSALTSDTRPIASVRIASSGDVRATVAMYFSIAKRAESLARDVLAVAGRERRQPIRCLGAKRLVGIRERHRREDRDVVDPCCGGAAHPHITVLARQTHEHGRFFRIRAGLVNGREPVRQDPVICAWVGS